MTSTTAAPDRSTVAAPSTRRLLLAAAIVALASTALCRSAGLLLARHAVHGPSRVAAMHPSPVAHVASVHSR